MIAVSEAWRTAQKQLLAPEGFVEISMLISEDGVQEKISPESEDAAWFSDIESITDPYAERSYPNYATFEWNMWILDGSRNIISDESIGYASESVADTACVVRATASGDEVASVEGTSLLLDGSIASVEGSALILSSAAATVDGSSLVLSNDAAGGVGITLTLDTVHTHPIQGITITWSEEFSEWATDFTVAAYNGIEEIARTEVNGNKDITTKVDIEFANYDRVVITVSKWSMPEHRVRIEKVFLGVNVVYTKSDLMNYTHTQSGCIISGELPKNSIEFSLDNSDGRWNPNNPQNIERYLAERQKVTVRYGFKIDNAIEWIKGGTFYLSEWNTPSNGLEATFVARDVLEFMMDVTYEGALSGTLYELATAVVAQAGFPETVRVELDDVLKNYSIDINEEDETEYTLAEILQMCANAAGCILYQNSEGTLIIQPLVDTLSPYVIENSVAYSHPEFELSKRLKAVEVSYGEETYKLPVASTGETQTAMNPFVTNYSHAATMAEWIAENLKHRQTIRGEYRADPRLELFDVITIESKYGTREAVAITELVYSFTGAFRGSYMGRVVGFKNETGLFCGDVYAGEV